MRGITISICLLVIGCGPAARDGLPGGADDDGSGGDANPNGDGCAGGTELVYTIDQFGNQLSTFDPSTKMFHTLGALNCPTMFGATPFSMSVDRNATAYVLYDSGEIFRVALPGLACTKTTWVSQSGLKVFGMGFSTDQPGGSTETLFIGGGLTQDQATYTLARVSTATMAATTIGSVPQLPEMTGTGQAALWGFMPDTTSPRVVQFDKSTGAIMQSFPQPTLAGTMTGYAFAQWGGDYWVFLIKNGEPSSSVYQVDGMTGALKSTTLAPGRTIVGAGVSTCAPTVIL